MVNFYEVTYKKAGNTEIKCCVYLPTRPAGDLSPVLFYCHGGSWIQGNKDEILAFRYFLRQLRMAGIAVISFDYRLALDGVKYPLPVDDFTDGVRYFLENAGQYQLNPENYMVGGASAGAQMSMLTGLAGELYGEDAELKKKHRLSVKAILNFCGPAVLFDPSAPQRVEASMVLSNYLGATYEQNKELYEQASPLCVAQKYPEGKKLPPMFAMHGTNDRLVNPEMPKALGEVYRQKGGEFELLYIQNASHEFRQVKGQPAPVPGPIEMQEIAAGWVKRQLLTV